MDNLSISVVKTDDKDYLIVGDTNINDWLLECEKIVGLSDVRSIIREKKHNLEDYCLMVKELNNLPIVTFPVENVKYILNYETKESRIRLENEMLNGFGINENEYDELKTRSARI